MRKLLCFYLVLCVPFVSYAQLQDSHFYKVDDSEISSDFQLKGAWKSSMEGSFFNNSAQGDRERLMKIKLYGKFNIEWPSIVSVEFEPYLVVSQGETQYRRFTKSETSPIHMKSGLLHVRPINGMSLQLGAIDQSFLNAPLLVSDQTFVSALAGYLYIKDNYEVQVVAQQAMPSIVNTFKRYGEIARPSYFTSLFVYGEWLPSNLISFKGHITGFYFTNLPSFIAHNSRLYGNSIEGNESLAHFKYSYYGTDVNISSQIKLGSKLYLSVGGNGLINWGAPLDKSWGERIYASLDIDFFNFARVYSRVEYFYNNSDSAPAYFNSEIYGHNDRQGFLTELKAFFPKGNFEAGFRYVLSRPITPSLVKDLTGNLDRQHSLLFFIGSRYKAI